MCFLEDRLRFSLTRLLLFLFFTGACVYSLNAQSETGGPDTSIGGPASSQGGLGAAQSDPAQAGLGGTAATLLQSSIQRAGWDVDWSHLSATYTGSVTAGTHTTATTVEGQLQGRTKARLSSTTATGTTISVVNDRTAWISFGTSKYLVPYDSLYDSIAVFPFFSNVSATSDPLVSVSYDGVASLGGSQTYKITIHHAATLDPAQRRRVDARSYDTRVWLAVDTMMPVQIESRRSTASNAFATVMVRREYADYRPVNGIMVPFTIREFMDRSLISTLSIANIQFGVALPATDFQATN